MEKKNTTQKRAKKSALSQTYVLINSQFYAQNGLLKDRISMPGRCVFVWRGGGGGGAGSL